MAQTQWPDRHKVLKHLTEAELQRYGMLELDNAQRPSLTNAVHPIFRHANWVNVRLAHQTQLRPSLRLASHFLTSPQLLPFWHTLLFGQRLEVPRHVAVGPNYGHTLYSFHRIFDVSTSSFALSTLDIERTLDALVDLAGSVTFTINREPASLSAVLLTWRNFDSAPPNGFGGAASLVMVDRRFLDAYAELDVSVSQRLRLQFEIAVGLTHEVSYNCTLDSRFTRCNYPRSFRIICLVSSHELSKR